VPFINRKHGGIALKKKKKKERFIKAVPGVFVKTMRNVFKYVKQMDLPMVFVVQRTKSASVNKGFKTSPSKLRGAGFLFACVLIFA